MSKKAVKQQVSVADGVLTCAYPSIGKKLVVKLSEYPVEIYRACAAADHGIEQKFGDAKSGKSAREKYEDVLEIHASLLAGEWKRTASPDLTPLILEAVSRIKKVSLKKVEEAVEAIEGDEAREEKVREWGAKVSVKAEIAKIRAERAAKRAEEAEEDEIEIELDNE